MMKKVFECEAYSIEANEVGFVIKTKERIKWIRLEHFLNYDIELENEIEDLKTHIRKWESFYEEFEKTIVRLEQIN